MALTPEQVKTWVEGFKYNDSIVKDVQRKFLAHYVNVARVAEGENKGQTDTAKPTWEILGYKVEDASISYNWEDEPVTDICGVTHNSITRSQPEINLEGYIVNTKSTFLEHLAKMAIRNAYDEFSGFEILTVFYWLKKGTTYLAKRETGCTIKPDSMGGEGYVRIAPVITLSNNATFGSVAEGLGEAKDGSPTFTEGTAS